MLAKRGNKAQITIFVVLAILIVAAIVIFIFARGGVIKPAISEEEAQKIVAAQVQPIKDKIEGCAAEMARTSVDTLGHFGGLAAPSSGRVLFGASETMPGASSFINYALLYDTGAQKYINFLPSLNRTCREELPLLFRSDNPFFEICIDDFSEFKKLADIKAGEFKIKLDELDCGEKSGSIVIPFSYPIEISKGKSKTVLDNYQVSLPINLEIVHDTASMILNKIASEEDYMQYITTRDMMQLEDYISRQGTDKPLTEQIFVTGAMPETLPSTSDAGKSYNINNIIFKLEYERQGLSPSYQFYFVSGLK
jgi:hypothetical protein